MAIKSIDDPLVRRIKRLQENSRYRRKQAAFVVEGIGGIRSAVRYDASFETIVFCKALLKDKDGQVLLAEQRSRGCSCIAMAENVYREISQRNNPDGLAAVCKTMWWDLDAFRVGRGDVFVCLVDISDPGNLGTILRTMDAVGAAGVVLVGKSSDPFHPRTVRASKGTIFTVPMCYVDDIAAVFDWAHANGIQVVATSARAGATFREDVYRLPTICVLGNEHRGLDREVMDNADQLVTIPMEGTVSSLNVSVAASLVLYEVKRVADYSKSSLNCS